MLLSSLDLFANGYTPATGTRFYASLVERLKGLPDVKGVTLMRRAPLGIGGSSSSTVQVEGYAAPDDRPAWAQTHVVGPEYFRTMQARLARGRDFAASDGEGAPPVVIVDEEMARRYWAGRDPVGSRINLYGQWRTVVGLAGPMKYRTFSETAAPHVFVPVLQVYTPNVTVAVRTDGDPLDLAPVLRDQVRALDPQLPLFAMVPFEEHARTASFQQRMAGTLLAGFGALALLLSTIGLYGLLAYTVGQRTREIGIRMALGGGRGSIFALIVRHGLRLTAVGVALGLAAAAAATRGLSRLLVGVSPTDPLTFAAVAAVLAAVAFLACAVPARRATRIDPAIALRYE
jgi:predicted permease